MIFRGNKLNFLYLWRCFCWFLLFFILISYLFILYIIIFWFLCYVLKWSFSAVILPFSGLWSIFRPSNRSFLWHIVTHHHQHVLAIEGRTKQFYYKMCVWGILLQRNFVITVNSMYLWFFMGIMIFAYQLLEIYLHVF